MMRHLYPGNDVSMIMFRMLTQYNLHLSAALADQHLHPHPPTPGNENSTTSYYNKF